MHFGTVCTFDPVTQTGLILPDQGRATIAIDRDAVARAGLGQLAAGQRLGFNVEMRRRGSRAVDLWATWSGR
jgi:cold shock CspA family protein